MVAMHLFFPHRGFELKWTHENLLHCPQTLYKSVVLGLIFLKYISDMFEQVHERVEKEGLDNLEDRDVYLAERVFWVPKEARWKNLQDNAKQESIGNLIDLAMEAIEQDNPNLKGMLPPAITGAPRSISAVSATGWLLPHRMPTYISGIRQLVNGQAGPP
jgi:hypothetical protein